MDHRQWNVIEQKTRYDPKPGICRSAVWVAGVVVHERIRDADTDVIPVEVGEAAAGEEVIDNVQESEKRAEFSLDGGPKEKWVS